MYMLLAAGALLACSFVWWARRVLRSRTPRARRMLPDGTPGCFRSDVHGLAGAWVREVVTVRSSDDVRAAIQLARESGCPISVCATQASGSHTYSDGAIVLDMSKLNKIISLDVAGRRVVVEAGITWLEILCAVDVHGLSVACSQSAPSFSVGGSLSSNIHGRDIRTPVVESTVLWLKYMGADGEARLCYPADSLFPCIVGGFGLFGVILEVCLALVPNENLRIATRKGDFGDLAVALQSIVREPGVVMLHAHYSTAGSRPSAVYYKTYERVAGDDPLEPMDPGRYADIYSASMLGWGSKAIAMYALEVTLLSLSRWSRAVFGRLHRWYGALRDVQYQESRLVTRNNSYLSRFRPEYPHEGFLELFAPVHALPRLVASVWDFFGSHGSAQLQSLNTRYVGRRNGALLSYIRAEESSADWFTLVIYYRLPKDDGVGALHRHLVGIALQNGGSYYLTYHAFAAREQLVGAYPRFEDFKRRKLEHDPQELFTSVWWQRYRA